MRVATAGGLIQDNPSRHDFGLLALLRVLLTMSPPRTPLCDLQRNIPVFTGAAVLVLSMQGAAVETVWTEEVSESAYVQDLKY